MAEVTPTVPSWLDKAFCQKAFRSYRNDDTIEILNFEMASSFSEHFCSTMFKLKIEFQSSKYPKSKPETLNVVVKVKPISDEIKMQVVADNPLFENEIRMYKETLPAIHNLFERSGMKIEFGPELIYATDDPVPIIVLKDMSPEGYFAPQLPPEEFDDSKLIIERLAQFHAAAFYLVEVDNLDLTMYDFNPYKSQYVVDHFVKEALFAFREAVESWDGYQCYLPKLDHFIDNVAEIAGNSFIPNNPGCGVNVLNHGDFHMRNILLKNNHDKRLESVRFIDYQCCNYCSPGADLAQLVGVVRRGNNSEPVEELIMFYHQKFVESLRTFGYMKTPPTLLDVNIEVLKHGAAGILSSLFFTPFEFVDWSNIALEDLYSNDQEESRKKKIATFNHPKCQALLKKDLKSWVHKGWL